MKPRLGLLLGGSAEDLAALARLSSRRPGLLEGPWWSAGSVVASALLDGLEGEVERLGLELVPFEGGGRRAEHLLEAIRPRPLPGDPPAPEACFVVNADDPEATRGLERVLRLGRTDARICEWPAEEGPQLCLRLTEPPLYLLMRARDEREVRAYTREDQSPLWVEWGFAHPLAELARARLEQAGVSAFVDGQGRWRHAPRTWPDRNVHDAIAGWIDAPTVHLDPEAGTRRFTVRLRLEPGGAAEPELWILEPAEFLRLEALATTAPRELLNQLTVARMTGAGGTRYVLRARGSTRQAAGLAARVGELVEREGFARAAGTEALFLPAGCRLAPALRPADLRDLLGLEGHPVILRRTGDGLERVEVRDAEEAPLSQWVDYVAMDHRLVLDALREESVFAVESVEVVQPRPTRNWRPPPMPKRSKKKRRARPAVQHLAEQVDERAVPDQVRAAQARLEAVQAELLAGGCEESEVWSEAAECLLVLQAPDDAAICLEAARFHGSREDWGGLLDLRARQARIEPGADRMLELLTREQLETPEAAWLATGVLAGLDEGAEDAVLRGLEALLAGSPPISRRLSWMTRLALHTRSGDTVGLTRARESLLGELNVAGLREAWDAPRFVRFALALGDEGGVSLDVAQQEGLGAIWACLEPNLQEHDEQSLLYRCIFAVGFQRVGALQMARDLTALVQEELPIHDEPVQRLARLYLARIGLDDSDPEERALWDRLAEDVLDGADSSLRRRLESYRNRSPWLGYPSRHETEFLPAGLEDRIDETEAAKLPDLLAELVDAGGLYDSQLARATEAVMAAALRGGNEAAISQLVALAQRLTAELRIVVPRVRVAGAALEAAALIDQGDQVDLLLDHLVRLAPELDQLGQLITPVNTAISALRRVGAGRTAGRCLKVLERLSTREHKDAARLGAAVARGWWLAGDPAHADETLANALRRVLRAERDYVARYEGAVAVAEALRSWSPSARQGRCEELLLNVDHFRDTFTTSRWFGALRLLLVERVVDVTSDARTFVSARLQGWLEAEEQAVRRRIVKDWRAVCG